MTRKIALGITTAATALVLITVAGLIVLLRTPPVDSTAGQTLDQGPALDAGVEPARSRQMRYGQLGETDVLLADAHSQATGLRGSVRGIDGRDAAVDRVQGVEDTNAPWPEREKAYRQQIELANNKLAQSFDAETVRQMERAYAQLLDEANARLTDAFDQLQVLQGALRQARDRNTLLLEREDAYQRQLEEADRLLNSPTYTRQSKPDGHRYESEHGKDEDDSSQSRS